MAANPTLADAIEACSDAAFEFKRWPDALQKLADSMGVTSCVLRTSDPTHPYRVDQRRRTVETPDSKEHGEFSALWLERIEGAPDPHDDRVRRLGKPPFSFYIEDEITTPEERNVLPYYQEIARPGHREWWGSASFMVKNRKWCLSMFRDARRGPFAISEAQHFLRVVPHLSQIISVAEKAWEVSIGASLAALETLNCAAALLDSRGCIKRLNAPADALCGSGLMVRHGRLHAADRASDARLQALIASAVLRSRGRPVPPAEPAIIASNGSPWLLAEALPITSFAHDLFNGGDALLHFSGLRKEAEPQERLLSRTFELTPAEARLASRLASGEGLDAALAGLAIGRETARTQLRAIFAKTGTRRQAELAALLSRLRKPFPR
jgi:DNA-binding CsgD family transcriptional regulator